MGIKENKREANTGRGRVGEGVGIEHFTQLWFDAMPAFFFCSCAASRSGQTSCCPCRISCVGSGGCMSNPNPNPGRESVTRLSDSDEHFLFAI